MLFVAVKNGKIKQFQNTLSQQLSKNLTHSSNKSNTFTQILKEVLNNDNTVGPKTVNESSDSNRSITCSGKTIHYLSKPVLCLDGEYMNMDMNVDNVNKHDVMNDKSCITYLSNIELDINNTKLIFNIYKDSDDIVKSLNYMNVKNSKITTCNKFCSNADEIAETESMDLELFKRNEKN